MADCGVDAVASDSPIASQTDATAHAAGWLWDIGLPTRHGIGCVYSSAHLSDDAAAATLQAYIARTTAATATAAGSPTPRRLAFRSGFRERYWVRNCLAVGLSAGFLEPLEASAIVTIEMSLNALIEGLPSKCISTSPVRVSITLPGKGCDCSTNMARPPLSGTNRRAIGRTGRRLSGVARFLRGAFPARSAHSRQSGVRGGGSPALHASRRCCSNRASASRGTCSSTVPASTTSRIPTCCKSATS